MDAFEKRLLNTYPLVIQMGMAERLLYVYVTEINRDEFRSEVTHHWVAMTVNTGEFIAYRRKVIERERTHREKEFWRIHG